MRSTPMIPVNEEMREEAEKIVGEAVAPLEQAKKLFNFLSAAYKYTYPPAERGAMSMRSLKKGDCGEFSFLFASWCRSLGIPCRAVIGSWAYGSSQAHVWNEFFVDQMGWVPVDASLAVLLKNVYQKFMFNSMYGTQTNPDYYFGNLEGTRIIFSLDANLPLFPALTQRHPPDNWVRLRFADRDFAWGFEMQEETAPYLQPCYVGFQQDGLLDDDRIQGSDLLGTWRVYETPLQQMLLRTKQIALYAGIGIIGVEQVAHWAFHDKELSVLGPVFPILYMVYFLCRILRRETNSFVYLLFLVFLCVSISFII